MIKLVNIGNLGNLWDEKGHAEISQIFVSLNEDGYRVTGIQFQYFENGALVISPVHGYRGPIFYTVQLSYPSEFLIRVSGKYDNSGVTSLTFTTNKGTHGLYGCNASKIFDFCFGEKKQFGGFHGSFNRQGLTSIGVYVIPSTTTPTLIHLWKYKILGWIHLNSGGEQS